MQLSPSSILRDQSSVAVAHAVFNYFLTRLILVVFNLAIYNAFLFDSF